MRRREALRRRLQRHGDELLVGYVGRLAREERVHLLGAMRGIPGIRVDVVGDGPDRGRLQRLLPAVTFTGCLHGRQLATAVASLDVFVHTGAAETYRATGTVLRLEAIVDLNSHRALGMPAGTEAAEAFAVEPATGWRGPVVS